MIFLSISSMADNKGNAESNPEANADHDKNIVQESLPQLRHLSGTEERTMGGTSRPPPTKAVFSIEKGTAPTARAQVRFAIDTNQFRITTTPILRPRQIGQYPVHTIVNTPNQRQVVIRRVPYVRQPSVLRNRNSEPTASQQYRPNQTVPVRQVLDQQGRIRQALDQQTQQRPSVRAGSLIGTCRPMMIISRPPALQQQNKTLLENAVKLEEIKPTMPSISSPEQNATEENKENKWFPSANTEEDDIKNVVAMGGIKIEEEKPKGFESTKCDDTQMGSVKEEIICSIEALQHKIRQVSARHQLEEPTGRDVAECVAHAAQQRLRYLLEKLSIISEHRTETVVQNHPSYEMTSDIKGQLKFLEDLDRAEKKRHEEAKREEMMGLAKSRSKTNNPMQLKLKAKAKEMKLEEMKELQQRQMNETALQAIGPRKKLQLESDVNSKKSQAKPVGSNSGSDQIPPKKRMKTVTSRDLMFLFEQEKDLCRNTLLYKLYMK